MADKHMAKGKRIEALALQPLRGRAFQGGQRRVQSMQIASEQVELKQEVEM